MSVAVFHPRVSGKHAIGLLDADPQFRGQAAPAANDTKNQRML
jgi:hypothetical protein